MVILYGEQRIFVVGDVVMVLGGVFAGAAVMPRAVGYLAPTVSVAPHP
jgi:hypothetical protein